MSNKWKVIIVIFIAIITIGFGLTFFGMFSMQQRFDQLQNKISLDQTDNPVSNGASNGASNESSSNNNPSNGNENQTPVLPDLESNGSSSNEDSNVPSEPDNDSSDSGETDTPINPNPDSNNPSSDNNNDSSPPNPGQSPSDNVTTPNEPPKEENGVVDGDMISMEMQKSLISHLDKYELVKNSTNYQDFFLRNKELLFDNVKLKKNIYPIINKAILNTKTYNENTMSLSVKVQYQIQKNGRVARLWIQWSTKLKNIAFNVIKHYYDKIKITLG